MQVKSSPAIGGLFAVADGGTTHMLMLVRNLR